MPAPSGLAVLALVPAAIIDVRERRLPDTWVAGSVCVLVVATMIAWVIDTPPDVGPALAAGVIVCGPILLLHLLSPASMGFGDVKTAAVIGLAVGTVDWKLGVVALTLAAGSAATFGVVTRARTVAFGPFLLLGAWAALLGNTMWLSSLTDGPVAP
ncbi:MAG: A24 family peptidase [Ilumatobacteraceae bacterium]